MREQIKLLADLLGIRVDKIKWMSWQIAAINKALAELKKSYSDLEVEKQTLTSTLEAKEIEISTMRE